MTSWFRSPKGNTQTDSDPGTFFLMARIWWIWRKKTQQKQSRHTILFLMIWNVVKSLVSSSIISSTFHFFIWLLLDALLNTPRNGGLLICSKQPGRNQQSLPRVFIITIGASSRFRSQSHDDSCSSPRNYVWSWYHDRRSIITLQITPCSHSKHLPFSHWYMCGHLPQFRCWIRPP